MKVLESLKINDHISKFNKWGCGCDYLRLSYTDKSELIEFYVQNLDTDNSNYSTLILGGITFTIQKMYCKTGIAFTFTCSYNDVSVPCFQFVKFNENTNYHMRSYGKLDYYGSLFRLVDIGFFDRNIFIEIKNLFGVDNPKVTRYDYRIDFFSYEEKKVPTAEQFIGYIHSQSQCVDFKTGNTINDWICGSKKNGRYAIRYYDKLLDTDKKQKCFLYQDYFKYKTVHRLEFEFQRNFLRGFTFYDFYDFQIQDKIEKVLRIDNKLFRGSIFYQYEDDYRITEKNKVSYLKRFDTSCIRLAKNNINPLIQCYKSIFYELEEEEFLKNVQDFMDFVGQDKQFYQLRYNSLKQEFLNLHKI